LGDWQVCKYATDQLEDYAVDLPGIVAGLVVTPGMSQGSKKHVDFRFFFA
jgi:hypothetical protein